MPTWEAEQYLRFAAERTRPCRDLAARVAIESPRRAIDLGCGPGNSTEVLAARWPKAEVTGLDSSPKMIERATATHPGWRWAACEIAEWSQGEDAFDVVFSNAALQWVPDHPGLFPRLMARVAAGGALAIQMPGNYDAEAHRLMRVVASHFPGTENVGEWFTHGMEFYYDLLAPRATRVDLWATEYFHVMDGPEAIVEWYKGSGMRPFLDALPGEKDRERFTAEYLAAIRRGYPARPDGSVLFPFRRLFIVAYR
jgi:trans-aconitate 2-methyltransferase